ncbi:MAG TPA: metallophosphoesterase [Polyangiaceae bacterium]|nr:metallophosphoesterase [Polyangiaceae bacterium]
MSCVLLLSCSHAPEPTSTGGAGGARGPSNGIEGVSGSIGRTMTSGGATQGSSGMSALGVGYDGGTNAGGAAGPTHGGSGSLGVGNADGNASGSSTPANTGGTAGVPNSMNPNAMNLGGTRSGCSNPLPLDSGGLGSGGLAAPSEPTQRYSFFAFGDAHAGQNDRANSSLKTAVAQMKRLDASAVLAISNGDLVEDSSAPDWAAHDAAISLMFDPKTTLSAPGMPRYLAAMDNHDQGFPVPRSDWLAQWNQHLPGQQLLGHNGKDGIYYAVVYADTLFIVLDSLHPSAAQTKWLASLFESPETARIPVKLAFFHEPIYACSSEHPAFAAGLAWADLFETQGVKLVFVSHLHFYDRTCPLWRGACRADGKGVVYQQLGPLGANNFRTVDLAQAKVSGKDYAGNARTDNFACSGANSVFLKSRTNVNDFCHVRVEGCRVTGNCYEVGEQTSEPFDTWQVDACTPTP